MKTRLVILFAILSASAFAQQAHWEGTLQMPNREMQLTVDLAKKAGGEWIGSLHLPDAGLNDVPLARISVKEKDVRFVISGLPMPPTFEAKLSDDGNTLAGMAKSNRGDAAFELKRKGDANVKLPPASTALAKEFEGTWQGTLDVPNGRKLRAIVKLARGADGVAQGSLVSVDEDNQEFPLTTIAQKEKQLQFEILVIRSKFTGTLAEGGAEIAGEYVVQGLKLPLILKKQ